MLYMRDSRTSELAHICIIPHSATVSIQVCHVAGSRQSPRKVTSQSGSAACCAERLRLSESLRPANPLHSAGRLSLPAERGRWSRRRPSASIPIQSFTAFFNLCLQPRCCSVVCTLTRVAPTSRLAGPSRSQDRPWLGRGGTGVGRVRGAHTSKTMYAPRAVAGVHEKGHRPFVAPIMKS